MRPSFVLPLTAGALLAWACPAPAAGQDAGGSAEITVTVGAGGTATVEGRYLVAPAPAAVELRALRRACSELGPLRVARDGAEVAVDVVEEGPWLAFRLPATPARDTLRLAVRYEVRLAGEGGDVPLAHPTVPIPQVDGEREGTVHLRVRGLGPEGHVAFPHMSRGPSGEWSARTVAVPSFVTVSGGALPPGDDGCEPPPAPPGGNGGLVWRFMLLVGIMVAWVPIYQAWASRSEEDG